MRVPATTAPKQPTRRRSRASFGAVVTLTMLPETKGMGLEKLNPEEAAGRISWGRTGFSVQSRCVIVQRAGALAATSSASGVGTRPRNRYLSVPSARSALGLGPRLSAWSGRPVLASSAARKRSEPIGRPMVSALREACGRRRVLLALHEIGEAGEALAGGASSVRPSSARPRRARARPRPAATANGQVAPGPTREYR